MSSLVLDASVALAAMLPDEVNTAAARMLMQRAALEGAVVPALWPIEVGNALIPKHRRGLLVFERITALLSELRAIPVAIDPTTFDWTWGDCVQLALRHKLTLYDAAYLELALRRSLPLSTFDKALRRAAEAEGVALANPPA